ncbi:MAG: polyprenyl synthetase family protein [Candidatus Heimdallarchaeota archaeon]|nr:polyprenyl synthetase family protein [Candidatus Heimdallarchaeota archaeon]
MIKAIAYRIGLAFQMRDDILNVFGDPTITGKPAGSDIVNGKINPLMAITLREMPEENKTAFVELLGTNQINDATKIIEEWGKEELEYVIETNILEALDLLKHLGENNTREYIRELILHCGNREK